MRIQEAVEPAQDLVNIENIDDSPGPYCMSYGFDLSQLIRSIGTIGLINRPLLIKSGEGRMNIITGYRRVHAFKFLKREKIPCRILPESSLSDLECILVNLYDNLAVRKLNHVEKGMVLNRLASHLPETEIIKDYMSLLDLPSRQEALSLFMAIERELDQRSKESLVRGDLALKTSKWLLKLDHESRVLISDLLSSLKFNSNKQAQLFEYLIDLKHINEKPIPEILGDAPIKKILSDENLNIPQKSKAVLGLFRNMRFPTLAGAESAFRKEISRLNLPKDVKIFQSSFFEAPYHRLEIRFRKGEDLKAKIAKLARSNRLETLHDPWEKTG